LLKAFSFFDRNLVGYLRPDDFETILHSLGRNFSRHFVKQLLAKFEANKKIVWKKLTERELE
jgi:Ca2+-binding EF-hand superfamily protein